MARQGTNGPRDPERPALRGPGVAVKQPVSHHPTAADVPRRRRRLWEGGGRSFHPGRITFPAYRLASRRRGQRSRAQDRRRPQPQGCPQRHLHRGRAHRGTALTVRPRRLQIFASNTGLPHAACTETRSQKSFWFQEQIPELRLRPQGPSEEACYGAEKVHDVDVDCSTSMSAASSLSFSGLKTKANRTRR